MEKSQSSECLRRKVCVITGQQHLNRLAGLLLLTQNSGCVFTEVGAVPCPLSLRREGPSALHHRNPEQQWLQEEFASPTAGHNSASHQIFAREQITFNFILLPSGTLLDFTGHIRVHNTQWEQGPAWSLPSWQSSAHTNYHMLLFRAMNNPNRLCGSCQNRCFHHLQQSTWHYLTSNCTPWEDTNSTFTLASDWTSLWGKHPGHYGARSLWLCVWQRIRTGFSWWLQFSYQILSCP